MICLYCYEIPVGGKVESKPYLMQAVSAYLAEAEITYSVKKEGEKQDLLLPVQVEKSQKGKPFIQYNGEGFFYRKNQLIDFPEIHISATHTKNLVICAVGQENVGIDCEIPSERHRQERRRPEQEMTEAQSFEQCGSKQQGREGTADDLLMQPFNNRKWERPSYERIASRFFTERELDYVRKTGEAGFFEIWVRKEAYMKYTGEGMAYGFRNIETRSDGCEGKDPGFLPEINGCRMLFEKRDGLYFACAGGSGEFVWK